MNLTITMLFSFFYVFVSCCFVVINKIINNKKNILGNDFISINFSFPFSGHLGIALNSF